MDDMGGVVVYPVPDSSPQAKRGYQMTVLTIIGRDNMVRLHELSSELDRRSQDMPPEDRIREWIDESEIMEEIETMIMRHVAPAVELGFGRSNLAAKFHAIMHQLFLLSPSVTDFAEIVRSVPVWLSDQGTEKGMARVKPIKVDQVLEFAKRGNDDVEVCG